jgi:hypothetical protein
MATAKKPRIFISHSAKEPFAEEVQKALVAALEPERAGLPAPDPPSKYRVLLDRTELKPGDGWRKAINLWLGGCDAAVVLLSKAALKSYYVVYETSILSYRAEAEESFRLIPVFLEDVDDAALRKSMLSPQQLAEYQAVRKDTVEEIVQEVEARLAAVALAVAPTPVEVRAKSLASLLPDDLDAAAQCLKLDVDPWVPVKDVRQQVALGLLGVGMLMAVDPLLHVKDRLKGKVEVLQSILDVVASGWVDYHAVDRIPKLARRVAGDAFGTNAAEQDTARMYITCARTTRGDAESGWHVAFPDVTVGEDAADTIVAKVRKALASELRVAESSVSKKLAAYRATGQPVIVVLPNKEGWIDGTIMNALRAEPDFGGLTYFLLMGDTVKAAGEPLVELLTPLLGTGDEPAFLAEYVTFKLAMD